VADDPHKPLRDDVRLLGGLLSETLRRQAINGIAAGMRNTG